MKHSENLCIGVIHFGHSSLITNLIDSIPEKYWDSIVILDHNLISVSLDPRIKIFHDPQNPGFSVGMNHLINYAILNRAEYFVGLNNDLELSFNSIEILIENLFSSGLSLIQGTLISPMNRILCSRQRLNKFFHWVHNLDRHKPIKVDQRAWSGDTDFVCGAFFAVDLVKFSEQPIFFDEDFFLYHEDIEWSLRLREAGHRFGVCNRSLAIHKESAATGRGITLTGIRYRWGSLKIYLRKTNRNPLYKIFSVIMFWFRMLFFWSRSGYVKAYNSF